MKVDELIIILQAMDQEADVLVVDELDRTYEIEDVDMEADLVILNVGQPE